MKNQDVHLCFFGDSVCVGQGVSIWKGWVSQVAKTVDDRAGRLGAAVLTSNVSVNGRTTRQALEDMPYSVQSANVDVLVIQFGLNDCNFWKSDNGVPRVSPDAFRANLHEMVARAAVNGVSAVVLNTNHTTARRHIVHSNESTYEDWNRHYNNIIRSVCEARQPFTRLTDFERAFESFLGRTREDASELLLEDGLHLNSAGHKLCYETALPIVEDAIRDVIQARSGRLGERSS